jgi:PAS domain S-box-containing protein
MLVDFSIKPLFDSEGKIRMLILEGRDITKSKQIEEALRESEDRFRRIFEDGPLGMAMVGADYRFVTVNRMFCEMLGYMDQELLTKSFADITHPEHLDQDMAEIKKLYTGEIARYRTEKRYIRKDGSVIWGSLTVSPIRNRQGSIVSTLALVEDITEQKRAGK